MSLSLSLSLRVYLYECISIVLTIPTHRHRLPRLQPLKWLRPSGTLTRHCGVVPPSRWKHFSVFSRRLRLGGDRVVSVG